MKLQIHANTTQISSSVATRRRLSYVLPLFLLLFTVSATGCCELTDECADPAVEELPEDPQSVSVKVGCWSASYNGFGIGQIGCGLLNTLGDPQADRFLLDEINIQRQFWSGIPANVSVFSECSPQQKNALSHPSGSILMGYFMFWDKIFSTGSALPVAGVLAHEWAHQVQFKNGWMNQNASTVRRTELEADAFAGFYMVLAKSWAGDQVNTFYQSLYNSGDYHFNNRNHHGTPQERLNAGILGVNVGIFAIQNNTRFTYQDLHNIFTAEISKAYGVSSAKLDARPPRYDELLAYLDRQGNTLDEAALTQLDPESRAALYPVPALH